MGVTTGEPHTHDALRRTKRSVRYAVRAVSPAAERPTSARARHYAALRSPTNVSLISQQSPLPLTLAIIAPGERGPAFTARVGAWLGGATPGLSSMEGLWGVKPCALLCTSTASRVPARKAGPVTIAREAEEVDRRIRGYALFEPPCFRILRGVVLGITRAFRLDHLRPRSRGHLREADTVNCGCWIHKKKPVPRSRAIRLFSSLHAASTPGCALVLRVRLGWDDQWESCVPPIGIVAQPQPQAFSNIVVPATHMNLMREHSSGLLPT
jgi:hypothetical protein